MRILIVNDDGIHATGIQALAKRLSREHEVTVVAPDSERSATSHSITIYRPLRVKKAEIGELAGVACYVTDGSPVDCAKIGAAHILNTRVDLIVSGINHGPNLGTDMLYSGTVAVALDAGIMGYSALAVSIDAYEQPRNLDAAAEIAARVIGSGLFTGSTNVLYNLNVPDLPLENIRGIRAARQGKTRYIDGVDVRSDPRGREYVWINSRFVQEQADEDTDVGAVENGFAAITPIRVDLTDTERMADLICRMEKIKLHM
jgi:5'-nucleotidase